MNELGELLQLDQIRPKTPRWADLRLLGALCAVTLGFAVGLSKAGAADGTSEIVLYAIAGLAVVYSLIAILIAWPATSRHELPRPGSSLDRAAAGEPFLYGQSVMHHGAGLDDHGGSDSGGGGDCP